MNCNLQPKEDGVKTMGFATLGENEGKLPHMNKNGTMISYLVACLLGCEFPGGRWCGAVTVWSLQGAKRSKNRQNTRKCIAASSILHIHEKNL